MRWLANSLLLFVFAVPVARAEVKPHPLFSDHMVLQRNVDVPVWGKADPGEKISVTIASEGAATVSEVTADENGQWKASLPKQTAGNGYTLTIKGNNTITCKDVAVGDVWVCSGQSNMEWKVGGLSRDNQGRKVAEKATNPNIRLLSIQKKIAATPQDDFPVTKTEGIWLPCTTESCLAFSAVGYFFGRDLEATQKVPVGLIHTSWGGTPAEAWTSKEGLGSDPILTHYLDTLAAIKPEELQKKYLADVEKYKVAAEKAKAANKPVPRAPTKPTADGMTPNTPTGLYNGMIAPLLKFPIKGAIWYQGESNAGRAKEYRTLFPAMISDWRKQWGSEFPFFAVQLAPFGFDGAAKVSYAELRDAQFHATKVLKNVGLAVITDSGEEKDIHPQKKEPAGQRLALAARAIAYGEKIEYSGPVYTGYLGKTGPNAEDNVYQISFDHSGGGLVCKGDELTGFTMCGEDKIFHPAKATIMPNKTIHVTCEAVAKPIAVRYGWVNFAVPELNLFNKEGLPAVPFRTDDFPLTTK